MKKKQNLYSVGKSTLAKYTKMGKKKAPTQAKRTFTEKELDKFAEQVNDGILFALGDNACYGELDAIAENLMLVDEGYYFRTHLNSQISIKAAEEACELSVLLGDVAEALGEEETAEVLGLKSLDPSDCKKNRQLLGEMLGVHTPQLVRSKEEIINRLSELL